MISPPKNHKPKPKPRARARAERARRQLREDWVDARQREADDVHSTALLILLIAAIAAAIAIGHAWLGIP